MNSVSATYDFVLCASMGDSLSQPGFPIHLMMTGYYDDEKFVSVSGERLYV